MYTRLLDILPNRNKLFYLVTCSFSAYVLVWFTCPNPIARNSMDVLFGNFFKTPSGKSFIQHGGKGFRALWIGTISFNFNTEIEHALKFTQIKVRKQIRFWSSRDDPGRGWRWPRMRSISQSLHWPNRLGSFTAGTTQLNGLEKFWSLQNFGRFNLAKTHFPSGCSGHPLSVVQFGLTNKCLVQKN